MKNLLNCAVKAMKNNKFSLPSGKGLGVRLLTTLLLLTLGVGQMWGGSGYNGETHVYLNVDGTTKYYKVSTESWSTGSSLPGTWGGVLKNQTFSNIHTLEIKGGAVGGWTENGGNISGNLYYKVTNSTTTPSSGWTTVGGINASYTTKSGNNCFRYKNDYSVNVTPHTAGTYYLHIKITDGASNNRTSYVKFTIPSYTVAGSSTVLGTNWDQTDTDNDMVWSSGTTYTLTKSNIVLTKDNTYEYKVAYNHAWTTAYPASNASIDFGNTTGHYDVTFTFNASTHAVSATATRLYAVTYNGNSNTSGDVPATTYHANGATVTVASNSGSLAKSGYSFGGWNTKANGSGTNYTAGSGTFTMGSADKPLYAKWTENMSTVSFVADPSGKGTFQVGGATVTSTTAGVSTTRSVTAVAADGYHWTGWSITGGATISSSSTNPTTVTGGGAGTAATLTATFAADATNTLTVTATTGGSITTPAAGYYSDITTTGYSIAASRSEGYKFTGWTKTAGDGAVSFANASSLSTTATITTLGDVTVTAGFAAMSNSLSVSSSSVYAGSNVTLTATKTNHTLDLKYQYKIGSGSWNTITTKSGTSHTYTIPYANTYQTYYFRVVSTDGSTDIISPTQTVEVKGRITIHVKNTNSWATMKLYSWYNDGSDHATNGAWNGTTGTGSNDQSCSVHATGSQWWDVTITQTTSNAQKFILSCSTSGDKNKTADLNLSSFTHDAYYAMSTNGSAVQTLSTTTTPAAPTLSTSAASSIAATSATLGGNVTNLGNDIISERGYYWSTNSTLSSSNLGVGTKVTVSGTQSSTGTFSNSKTGLTNGTTYYFIAYAKNGYGTSYGAVNNFRTKFITTVTLNMQGGSDGTSEVTATEGSAMPSGKTAPGKTGYTFGGYYASAGGSGKQYYTSSMGSANNWDVAASTATIHAKWTAKTYDVTLNVNGGSGANQTVTATYDAAMPTTLKGGGAIAARTRTGYNFAGYAQNTDGTGTLYYTSALANNHNWDQDVVSPVIYAKWTAKQSALTFDYQTSATGYGASGTISAVSATYDAAMPTLSGTMPTAANGYAFMGFYDATGGGGTKYYNADGSSAHNWDKDTESGTTLYAYYKKAEITNITFSSGAIVAPNTSITATAILSPSPAGTTHIDWKLRYGNDNALADQPSFGTETTTASFSTPAASGTYKLEAVLRTGSTPNAGTTLDSVLYSLTVAGDHTVTVRYKCGDDVIKAATTTTGRPLAWSDDITAPTIVGYTFVRWDAGDGVSIKNGNSDPVTTTTDATIKIKAIYDGTLTAVYSQKRVIYFYNTLNWENVYVYFYKNESYWGGSNQGTGANTGWQLTGYPYSEGLHGQMLPVEEGSKIYYFDAEAAGVNASYTNVAFTELNQHPCDYFYNNNKVVRRSDYHSTTMPLFVPLGDQTGVKMNGNTATYYSNGYWMNYPLNTGYTLKIYNAWNATKETQAVREFAFPYSDDLKMPLKLDVEFNDAGTHEYWFMVYRNDGTYLGNKYTFNQNYNDEQIITGGNNKSKLITSAPGKYTLTLTYHDNGSGTVNYYIDVDFPIALNDYRIVYKDNATWSNGAHSASWFHPSDVITKIGGGATEAKKDTLSFYISKGEGITPSMKFQYASAIDNGTGAITWTDVTSGSITIPSAVVTEAGVYNFIVSQPVGGGISVEKVEPYTGSYYIRTDCAGNTKWDSYKNADHLMPYSEYSIDHGGYSHYYTHWVQTGDRPNIKFVVANDYSSAISDTLIRESNAAAPWTNINNYIDASGNILRNANVRFMWNQSTNKVSRAYVDGAQGGNSDNFLYMVNTDSPNKIRWSSSTGLTSNKVTFLDNGDWIYEANIEAQPDAAIRVLSNWGTSSTVTQYFRGTSSTTEKLIGGSGSDWYKIRVIYDFKTNRLISSFVPSDQNITTENAIEADVMFIREHQGDIAQLTFGENGKISKIETAYGVMRFNKWTLNNKSKAEGHAPLGDPKSVYERSLFWISFPFRVKLSEVIGFGTYGTHWAVQRYDGAGRAANGYWAESSSYWRWMNRNTEYLEPDQGYLLAIDLDLLGESSSLFANTDQLEIYFPSYGTMPDITSADVTQTIPEHECTINWAADKGLPDTGDPRTSYNRTVFDSHWNVISVPTYVNTDDISFANTEWTDQFGSMNFLYTWNSADHTITATSASGYTYHAMHAYMVQYGGSITWSAASGSPAPIVARKTYAEQPRRVEFRLELQQNEQMIDRTYVALSNDEQTSAGFRFGEDMTKEFNANKSSIYTFIANEATVAGNTLPMTEQTTVVPMGVEIKTAGDYTFAIPDGTEGIGVTLIDTETGIRTSLSALDYTVNLTAGKHDSRFVLEISPIQQMPTDIDQLPIINDQSSVKKVLIDGLLYIVKDGQLFDATGKVVTR